VPERSILSGAIERIYHCKALYLRSVTVSESAAGRTLWDGVVYVFELIGHPVANRCYAWNQWEDLEGEHDLVVVVPGVPPVDSPSAAIKAATETTRLVRMPRTRRPPPGALNSES